MCVCVCVCVCVRACVCVCENGDFFLRKMTDSKLPDYSDWS